MKRLRFSEEQIIGVLKEAEAGAKTGELARRHGVSEATIYNWKAKYGGLEVSEAIRDMAGTWIAMATASAANDEIGRQRAFLIYSARTPSLNESRTWMESPSSGPRILAALRTRRRSIRGRAYRSRARSDWLRCHVACDAVSDLEKSALLRLE